MITTRSILYVCACVCVCVWRRIPISKSYEIRLFILIPVLILNLKLIINQRQNIRKKQKIISSFWYFPSAFSGNCDLVHGSLFSAFENDDCLRMVFSGETPFSKARIGQFSGLKFSWSNCKAQLVSLHWSAHDSCVVSEGFVPVSLLWRCPSFSTWNPSTPFRHPSQIPLRSERQVN